MSKQRGKSMRRARLRGRAGAPGTEEARRDSPPLTPAQRRARAEAIVRQAREQDAARRGFREGHGS